MKGLWLLSIVVVVSCVDGCLRRTCNESEAAVRAASFDTPYSRKIIGKYAPYDQTMAWYRILQRKNRGLVRLINIGKSYERRDQVVMRVSPRPTDDRPAIFIEATQHAREWLSTATLNYVIHRMIVNYRKGIRRYRRAMRKYIFYFMSISNPDGYVFTFNKSHPENRYWRKNRRLNPNGCVGVDLNRNWNIGFGGAGASSEPCSDVYQGRRPFSEVETRNMRRFMERQIGVGRLTLYISLHSFSQIWIVPWSYTSSTKPRNYIEMKRAAIHASRAAKRLTGGVYEVGNGAEVFGVTVAGSDDWTLRNMRANYSYTLECRPSMKTVGDDWRIGFNPNKSLIPLSGREVLESLLALVDTMNTR